MYNIFIMNTKILIGIATILITAFLYGSYTVINAPKKQTIYDAAKAIHTASSSAALISTDSAQLIPDHTIGNGKYILTEFADFQCPACRSVHEYFAAEKKSDKAFAKALDEKYTLVYKHYPLSQIHPHAQLAAQAAEAAGLQGKFIEFADAAFRGQESWSKESAPLEIFKRYAKDIGLNEDQFIKDMDSPAVAAKIARDIEAGNSSNLRATPSFYIDGVALQFANFDDLKRQIIEYSPPSK
jgi:protein-disulfide isomerase